MGESTNAITTREMTEHGDAIRKAFAAGRKFCLIKGRRFNLRKQARTRTVMIGPPMVPAEQVAKTINDNWIVATPTVGRLPVYSVEQHYGKNGTARSK